jgi:hypothetical protein
MAKPIPDGYHTLTPALTVKNGARRSRSTSARSAPRRSCRSPVPTAG